MQKLLVILLLFSFGCQNATNRAISNSCDTLYAPSYASHFLVLKSGDTTILEVKNPWQGATNVSFEYKFTKNTKKFVTMSSSHGAFLEAIGEQRRIVAVSGANFLTSPYLKELPDVGYDNNMNFELAVALAPDIVTIYEISGENSTTTQKLQALGLKTVYIADYLEQNPLAKAEWIVAFGAMCGKIDEAKNIFTNVEAKYNSLKDSISANGRGKRPKVMLNSPYRDVWYMPGDSSYIVQLIDDAGGQYVASGRADNQSQAVSIEVAYTMLQKADIWLNPAAHIRNLEQLKSENPLLKTITTPVFTNNARSNDSGGSDFWESGTIHPEIILKDLSTILSGGPIGTLYYYKQLR